MQRGLWADQDLDYSLPAHSDSAASSLALWQWWPFPLIQKIILVNMVSLEQVIRAAAQPSVFSHLGLEPDPDLMGQRVHRDGAPSAAPATGSVLPTGASSWEK